MTRSEARLCGYLAVFALGLGIGYVWEGDQLRAYIAAAVTLFISTKILTAFYRQRGWPEDTDT